jgi:uncharacterized membrane-anchored protein
MRIRNLILWGVALLIPIFVNYQAYQREQLAVNGKVVLLQLAPVDPRSLIQGDYMLLRYALSNEIAAETKLERGFVVVRLDANQVAHFARIHDSNIPLADNEILLPFRRGGFRVDVGPRSFFFQEGHAEYYQVAEYGELRVSESGSILLVGLRDANFKPLEPPK